MAEEHHGKKPERKLENMLHDINDKLDDLLEHKEIGKEGHQALSLQSQI